MLWREFADLQNQKSILKYWLLATKRWKLHSICVLYEFFLLCYELRGNLFVGWNVSRKVAFTDLEAPSLCLKALASSVTAPYQILTRQALHRQLLRHRVPISVTHAPCYSARLRSRQHHFFWHPYQLLSPAPNWSLMANRRRLQLKSWSSNVLHIIHYFGLRCGRGPVFGVKTSVEGVDERHFNVGCGVFCSEDGVFSDCCSQAGGG